MSNSEKKMKDTKLMKDLEQQSMLNNQLTTVLARNEALNIVVAIVNALVSCGNYSEEQLGVIQSAVNKEAEATKQISDNLFTALHATVDQTFKAEEINSDIVDMEIAEQQELEDNSCIVY